MQSVILVVDDDPLVREIVRAYLEPREYGVLTAPTGEDGLNTLRSCTPALVVLDLSMPRMHGLEMLQKMKADPRTRDVPVLVLTSSSAGVDVSAAVRAGAAGYLLKPFRGTDLVSRVQRLLEPDNTVYVDDDDGQARRA